MTPISQDRIAAVYSNTQQRSEKLPPTLKPSITTQQSTLAENWRVIKGSYWFLGDDAELEATSYQIPASKYLRNFVPKPFRHPEVLVLDPDRLLWTLYCQRVSAGNLIVPDYICELPVVVMLPTSPILCPRLKDDPMRGGCLDIDRPLYLRDVKKLWNIFPFAAGICIWMNGHMQVLAPGLSETDLSRLRLPAQVAGLNVSISRASLIPTAAEARHRPELNNSLAYPRVRIGQSESIAALPLKGRDGKYPDQTFVSASTHAVLEGTTGKALPMNRVPDKREKLKKIVRNIFRKERAGTVLAGIEVSDEMGNVIGCTVDELIYDEHPIPSNALFPDAMRHDLCLVGLRPESSANFVQPCLPKLSWFPDHHLPPRSNIAILHDDDNSDGKTFTSGVYVQKPIKVNGPNGRVTLLTSEVVDSSILYRRHAKPLKTRPKGMSGAAVVTTSYDREKGKHVYDQVAGFQSFQFVPPAAEGRPEDTSEDTSLEEDINRGKPLNCCICVARPIPERLRSDMEIINDDTEIIINDDTEIINDDTET